MFRLKNSFYGKLSVLFLILILGLGLGLTVLSTRALQEFVVETEQKLNHDLATRLSEVFQQWVETSIDRKMIEMEIQNFTNLNPRNEIYLLGSNGMIKAAFPNRSIEQTTVNVIPLRRYLEGLERPPYLADDPLRKGRMKPFSVAPISIMGEEGCYVYVILGGEQYDSVASTLADSYIMKTMLYALLLILGLTGFIGLILFFFLTKRLRGMQTAVRAFERGKFDQRVAVRSSDEIGQLGTSFNQMADTIVRNMDELKRVDQLRRELIANVSHDLRSPLASIQGYLETILIKDESLTSGERQKYLEIGLKNTRKLNTLVNDLFELSKLDARQIEPQFEPFSLAELAQDVVMQFKPHAEQAGVHLEAELPERLSMAYGDIALVERALSNLIDNAVRHTPTGGTVRIVPTDQRENLDVRVVDTGCGISEKDLPHIFERFYRVEKSRAPEKNEGSGLGLAIARKILELHGSSLAVQSTLNQGTTFSFLLPKWHQGEPGLRLA